MSCLTWLLIDDRRCDAISMVDAKDCRGGVAVSMCNLGAVAAEKVIGGQWLFLDDITLLQELATEF